MEKKLVVPCGDYNIVAYIEDGNLPQIPAELCVYLTDKNGEYIQDICLVRQQFEYGEIGNPFIPIANAVSCLVWSNGNSEDFTHDFGINVYEEDEE